MKTLPNCRTHNQLGCSLEHDQTSAHHLQIEHSRLPVANGQSAWCISTFAKNLLVKRLKIMSCGKARTIFQPSNQHQPASTGINERTWLDTPIVVPFPWQTTNQSPTWPNNLARAPRSPSQLQHRQTRGGLMLC